MGQCFSVRRSRRVAPLDVVVDLATEQASEARSTSPTTDTADEPFLLFEDDDLVITRVYQSNQADMSPTPDNREAEVTSRSMSSFEERELTLWKASIDAHGEREDPKSATSLPETEEDECGNAAPSETANEGHCARSLCEVRSMALSRVTECDETVSSSSFGEAECDECDEESHPEPADQAYSTQSSLFRNIITPMPRPVTPPERMDRLVFTTAAWEDIAKVGRSIDQSIDSLMD